MSQTKLRPRLLGAIILAAVLCLVGCQTSQEEAPPVTPVSISELIPQVSEAEIYGTAGSLQGFVTRAVGTAGNTDAATYIHDRLAAISGLAVVYQGGSQRNVVATLAGTDQASGNVYIVGAHYDSTSGTPSVAPGATDNACGVGIVLELARIMSKYRFRDTLKFAAWNSEEAGLTGSAAFVGEAVQTGLKIALYFNYDSAGYDPQARLILDIMFNANSASIADMMEERNNRYQIGFTITRNVHTCWSDHRSFWSGGFKAVMTHSELHGPAHTADDTVEKISTVYAKKNGQLGLAVLAELAGLSTAR